MKRSLNLMPRSCQRQFEHWRQARLWGAVWLATLSLTLVGYGVVERQRLHMLTRCAAAEVAVTPARRAEADIRRLQTEGQAYRQQTALLEALEQTDVPLALLQVVVDSCGSFGRSLQLDSLRMSEVGNLNLKGAHDGLRAPLKTLEIVGAADGDAQVASLVNHLQASGVFDEVELESTQAQSNLTQLQRSFRIRCRQ